MKKILLPVDFSTNSEMACTYALELAARFRSEIHLFHVFFHQAVIADGNLPDAINITTVYDAELLAEISRHSEKAMGVLADRMKADAAARGAEEVVFRTTVTGGDVETELLEILDRYQPDLVIIGSHGKGKSIGLWGSVSRFMVHHSGVPVLVIPALKKFPGFSDIMITVGYEKSNTLMLSRILEIFTLFRPVYHCVHFLSEKSEQIEEKIAALKIEYEEESAAGRMQFETVEVSGNVQKAIESFIASRHIVLIAFEPHRHSIFYNLFTRNITKKHLYSTHIPLLAVPMIGEPEH